jgi:hypothetical protein
VALFSEFLDLDSNRLVELLQAVASTDPEPGVVQKIAAIVEKFVKSDRGDLSSDMLEALMSQLQSADEKEAFELEEQLSKALNEAEQKRRLSCFSSLYFSSQRKAQFSRREDFSDGGKADRDESAIGAGRARSKRLSPRIWKRVERIGKKKKESTVLKLTLSGYAREIAGTIEFGKEKACRSAAKVCHVVERAQPQNNNRAEKVSSD